MQKFSVNHDVASEVMLCPLVPPNKDKYPYAIQEDGKQSVLKIKYIGNLL